MRRKGKQLIKTSFGWVGVAVSDLGIARIVLPRKSKSAAEKELSIADFPLTPALSRKGRGSVKTSVLMRKTVKLLQRYFSGKTISFDLPLDLRSHTSFQQAVWKACASIPSGETRSYGWIAKRIKKPNASRAVGQAMGANPVPILVP